ncbi:hypothetical protein [Glaciimonas sp. PCH181]|uniref:hypothetical protein n=1 Tax=Glaciimonas sp. PCH181 TaxID=2133943 RepID=UPI000D336C52|nr:hypothetical protein [Glaciimonas sp. PCH181]PUA19591.1 hypothetical protein C7W93_07025 [Glaciimonas sp. PCH181]
MADTETISTLAVKIRQNLKGQAAIVIIQHHNGSISMVADGCNHAQANSMLSLGIHLNLKQHDEQVLAGAAGQDAQTLAQEIEVLNA